MARAPRKAKAATPAEATLPAPVETPQPPAPAVEEETDAALRTATGTSSRPLQNALLSDVIAVLGIPPGSDAYTSRGGAALALMKGCSPRDELEGALAAQFVALHSSAMAALRRAAGPNLPPEVASRLRRDGANLFRAATEMVEAIEARRGNSGRQRITVEHISQAIIGVAPKEGGHG